ncbi:MAG: hypothetical protein IJV38_11365 [Prevotella sp.]|nr:hypothetical protein [Prevotella sp.]
MKTSTKSQTWSAILQGSTGGWVKSIKAENKNEAMGQKSVINTVVTLLK